MFSRPLPRRRLIAVGVATAFLPAHVSVAQTEQRATPVASPPGTPVAASGSQQGTSVTSWEEFDRAWSALAPAASFLAAEVVDDECVPIHALNPEARLAIGSTFKLYILGELADQIRDGTLDWDDTLAIREEWKATFSGAMNQLPAGEERTLREFAEQMISVSDNTATDHLLFHLGRKNVEAIQAAMGHGEPAVNQPLLSTQEMFQVKLAALDELQQEYITSTEEQRRAILAEEIAPLSIPFVAARTWSVPIHISEFEWFASAEDLCRAMATLDAWSRQPGLAPITEILAINPGLPFDRSTWSYIGYKGGSEVGVLNLTWLLGHANGGTYVMTGTLNNPDAAIDNDAADLLTTASQLLAESVS